MLTNKLTLTFCSDKIDQELTLSISERHGILVDKIMFVDCIENTVTFDIVFPNTLCIEIKDIKHAVSLKNIILSGLPLPDRILDQICHYRASTLDSEIVTRQWHHDGTVRIDFFASDWIQYHLLYGNKISKS